MFQCVCFKLSAGYNGTSFIYLLVNGEILYVLGKILNGKTSFFGKQWENFTTFKNYDLLLGAWFNRSCLIWSSNTNKIKGGKLMAISDCHNQISCLEMMMIEKILSNRIAWYFVLCLITIYFVTLTNISYLAGILCALG